MNLKQCRLEKDNRTITIWVPVKYAELGKNLTVDKDPGWIVKKVFKRIVTSDYLQERSQDYKNTRKASDI